MTAQTMTPEMFFHEVSRELDRPNGGNPYKLSIRLSYATVCDVHFDYDSRVFVVDIFDSSGDYDFRAIIGRCTPKEMVDLIRKSANLAFVEEHFEWRC